MPFLDTIKAIICWAPVMGHAVLIISSSPRWWGRDSCPRVMGMATQRAPDTCDWQQLWSRRLTARAGDSSAHSTQGHTGRTLRSRASQQAEGGGHLFGDKRVGYPQFPREDEMGWSEWSCSLAGSWYLWLRQKQPSCLLYWMKRILPGGALLTGAECRGGLGVGSSEALPASHVTQ